MKQIRTLTLIFLLSFFAAFKLAAQSPSCNYQINSNLSCTFNVKVEFYDNCSSTPCDSQIIPVSQGPNPVTCNNCGPLCNIVVTIAGTANSVNISNVGSPQTFTSSVPCGLSSVDMDWQYTVCSINQ